MLPVLVLALGAATLTLQQTTDGDSFSTRETFPTTYTTAELPSTDETFPTYQTTLRLPKQRQDGSSCKNHFLCTLQRKSTLSKGFPPVPSKNLVPPYTDEEERTTTEFARTTLNEAETESLPPTTIVARATSVRSLPQAALQKRDDPFALEKSRPEATNALRSYLPPKLSPAAAQVDLSYLPPKGVLPAAASLDISKVNYLPPFEESAAAAQAGARQLKPKKPEPSRKDICSDAFHSFLCAPLRSRKRITGALPNSLVPNRSVQPSFNSAASNTVQSAVSSGETAQSTYLPPSTPPSRPPSTPPPTPPTTAAYSPQPSNVDRSYLPPAPKTIAASPSFTSVKFAGRPNEIPQSTGRKPFSTSTPRPFIQTSIIPFISPKVIEQINLTPSTTPKPTTTQRPRTTTPAVRLAPEPSNEVNRGYLPPASTRQPVQKASALPTFQQRVKTPSVQILTEAPRRVTTTTPRYSPVPSNADRTYIPPAPKFEPAAAAQVNQAISAPAEQHDHGHDHHHHHHGKDLCSDPFHSFLCAPLKQRKRITGALPPGFNPQSTNRKETKVRPGLIRPKPTRPEPFRPEPLLKPENTFQSESRVSTEEVPAANALAPQSVGYQYPKPSPAFPLPSQTSTEFVRPTTPRPTPPRPTTPSPTTPRPTTLRPTTGYFYPKPSNPLPLPSQQNVEVIPKEDRLAPTVVTTGGYQYPKPSIPFPLPSERAPALPSTPKPISLPTQQKPVVAPTSPKPLQPQPSEQRTGYQYPKPEQTFPPSSGYQYPKPKNQLLLPGEERSGLSAGKPTLASLRDLGSAEFIPVNKIDAKRQVRTGTAVGPRFGERIRTRVRQDSITRAL